MGQLYTARSKLYTARVSYICLISRERDREREREIDIYIYIYKTCLKDRIANLRMKAQTPHLRARCCPNMIRFCSIWRQRSIGWGMSTAMVGSHRLARGSWNHMFMALFWKGSLVFHSVDPICRVHVKQLGFMMVGSIGQTFRNEDHRSCHQRYFFLQPTTHERITWLYINLIW